jgi:hypothetical protein
VSEPLVKVLRLVDSDKPTMGYLYEAMDRAKEAIRAYYVGKGSHGFRRQGCSIDAFMQQQFSSTLHFPTNATLLLMVR